MILKFNSFDFDPIFLLRSSYGKYEATLFHRDGTFLNCIVWLTKQENTNGKSVHVIWILRDSHDSKHFNGLRWYSNVEKEGLITLNDLYLQFKCINTNDSNDNIKSNKNAKSKLEHEVEKDLTHSQSIKKKKSFSLPELNKYSDVIISHRASGHIQNSNTSSNTSDNCQDFYFTKQTDLFYTHYKVENIIGKGAFGFVRLVKSIEYNQEFVVKFIRKSKLSMEHMVKVPLKDVNNLERRIKLKNGFEGPSSDKIIQIKDEIHILIPREIWMLCKLKHRNIVSLHDWYEGLNHFQMIMPKHGVGMDLFEFIDRSPILNEPLASYLFRQLVDAVMYLHNLMIAHRDIKDENIILDNQFNIKLIDFGAAIRVESGQKFKTFCGTMEFCSPEILLGNEYNCFHADIWSMGITLYTIMFGENPFYDFEETIHAVLKPPKKISSDLFQLLSWLLEPNPHNRVTAETLIKHSWINQEVNINQYSFEKIVPNPEFSGNMASDYRKYSNGSNCDLSEKSSNTMFRKSDKQGTC